MKQGTAIIIGAGPAGLTAAIELQRHSEIKPIVIEAGQEVGGISRTVCYKGNRMDIGGHRFFSKSDRVMHWWLELMPVEATAAEARPTSAIRASKRDIPAATSAADPSNGRLGHAGPRTQEPHLFFASLLRLSDPPDRCHVQESGPAPAPFVAALSYMRSALLPRARRASLEDFLINRFGKQLYLTFFKSYTEKVWGVPCTRSALNGAPSALRGSR